MVPLAVNFEAAFALECKAVKIVREQMGLYNLQTMIPFCRTPEEGAKVLEVMAKNGLEHKKIEHPREHLIGEGYIDKQLDRKSVVRVGGLRGEPLAKRVGDLGFERLPAAPSRRIGRSERVRGRS